MLLKFAVEAMALYLRHSPWERGRWRLLGLAWPWSHGLWRRTSERIVRTRHGFQITVDRKDWLGRHVYISGEYEPATAKVIETLAQPGDTILDIGANIGYFALLASRCVGPSGKVHAFEPVPSTRQHLLCNIRLNEASNIVVHEEAVSEAMGELEFWEGPADHRGTSSFRPLQNASGILKVRTDRLDHLLPAEERVALAKIDVEGAECRVLKGMRNCLERDKPDLVIEVTDSYLRTLGDSAAELRKMLYELGYQMYVIGNECLVPLRPDEAEPAEQYNALFTVRDGLLLPLRTSPA